MNVYLVMGSVIDPAGGMEWVVRAHVLQDAALAECCALDTLSVTMYNARLALERCTGTSELLRERDAARGALGNVDPVAGLHSMSHRVFYEVKGVELLGCAMLVPGEQVLPPAPPTGKRDIRL